MEETLIKIDEALDALEQKIKAKNEQILFEKGLLGAEMEKTLAKYAQIKDTTTKVVARLDEIIMEVETYKESL